VSDTQLNLCRCALCPRASCDFLWRPRRHDEAYVLRTDSLFRLRHSHVPVLSKSLHRINDDDDDGRSTFFMFNFTAKFQTEHTERRAPNKAVGKNLQFSANKSPYLRNGAR